MTNRDEDDRDAHENGGGIHRTLVLALADNLALRQLGDGQWLGTAEWALAIERVYGARHAHLPRSLGMRQLGRDLAERFLASESGAALAASLAAMTGARLVSTLLPVLCMRMCTDVVSHGVDEGARLTIEGVRVAPDEVALGAVEALARRLLVPCAVRVGHADGGCLELELVEDRALAHASSGSHPPGVVGAQ